MCDAARRENGRRGMQKTAKLEEGRSAGAIATVAAKRHS